MATIHAIYEDGQIRLLDEVNLKEGQELKIEAIGKLEQPPTKREFGIHRGLMKMSDDFDEPLPESFWLDE